MSVGDGEAPRHGHRGVCVGGCVCCLGVEWLTLMKTLCSHAAAGGQQQCVEDEEAARRALVKFLPA